MSGVNSTFESLLRNVSVGRRGSYIDTLARRSAKTVLNPLLGALRPGNIAMFHVGRVGSTVLTNMLKQSPRIYWANELFELATPRYKAWTESADYASDPDHIKFLRTTMREARNRLFGFETKFLDELHLRYIKLSLDEYINTLNELEFNYYIILQRKNVLRRLVSTAILMKTKRSHLYATESEQRNRVILDVNRVPIGNAHFNLIEAIKVIESGYKRLDDVLEHRKVCRLTYEDHIRDDPIVGYRLVMSFLRLKPESPKIHYRKTNPHPLHEIIENIDDVERELSGTPYHWMISE